MNSLCDCQNPPPDGWSGTDGVYHVSDYCPVHNENPVPLTRAMFLAGLAVLLEKFDAEIFATDFGTLRASLGVSDEETMPDQRNAEIFFEVDYCQSSVDSKKARILSVKYEGS